MEDTKALSGIKVYDATQGVAGPHAAMLLALHGADVRKVEPLDGDWCRVLGKPKGQHTVESLAINRGKRSLACDLKTAEGLDIARRLIAESDIFIESFRPGVIGKMGLGYEQVREIKPDIVYASISGFGQHGPNTQRPTVDGLIQAYSGMMVMNRTPDGQPHRQGMIAVDVMTGLYAYQAISSALIRKIRFGKGAYLDINMAQSAAAFQAAKVMEHVVYDGKAPPLYVPAGMFRTADGDMVISGMRNAHFAALCEVVGRPDLADDPRWSTQAQRAEYGDIIHGELRKEFVKRTTREWLKALHAAGVLAEVVQSYGDWLEDEHSKSVQAYRWTDTSEFGALPVPRIPGILPIDDPASTPGPLIGEHSREILRELGYTEEWIEDQLEAGVLRESVRP